MGIALHKFYMKSHFDLCVQPAQISRQLMCVNNGTTMDTVQIQQWRTGVRKLVTDVKVCIIARFFF